VDHGLTCHSDHKLRTVLWGWIGEALSAEELAGVASLLASLEGELGAKLAELLTAEEIASLTAPCARLRSAGRFPAPSSGMPAVPWPLFYAQAFHRLSGQPHHPKMDALDAGYVARVGTPTQSSRTSSPREAPSTGSIPRPRVRLKDGLTAAAPPALMSY